MLVAPPASLKTALTEVTDQYSNAALISDLTIRSAARMREEMIGGKLVTLAFTDFGKLYQRSSSTAMNIEGFISQITSEGARNVNWEDAAMTIRPARAAVLGCMTSNFYTKHFQDWKESGFARRFLWCNFSLYDSHAIMEALVNNVRLVFSENGFSLRVPTSRGGIQYKVDLTEGRQIEKMLRYQVGKEIGFTTLAKTLSALKWKHPKEPDRPMVILKDFAESLSKEGAELHLD